MTDCQALREVTAHLLTEIHSALCDNAGSYTCSEADAIDTLYITYGLIELGDQFMKCHASNDVDDDWHCVITDEHGHTIGWEFVTERNSQP
jgi:hypothetical protein